MEGNIHFKKTAHNTIFVRWNSLRSICPGSDKLVSPPFTLIINGCPISFGFSIECRESLLIRIHQNSSSVGSAIVLAAVRDENYGGMSTMKSYLIKKWGETCEFKNLGTFVKGTYYSFAINCKIIWLGFVNNIESANPSVSASAVATTFSGNRVFSDFTIIVEGQEIPSHKVILAHHSSVFSTMFETPMKELKENKVIIEDIECSTMEILLKIMYTGNAEDLTDVDVILKVLYAAEKYQISTIKSLCECKLQLLINEDNVLKLLKMGDKYNALDLCEICIAYIMAIRKEEISIEFKRLSQEMPNIGSVAVKVLMDLTSLVPYEHIK